MFTKALFLFNADSGRSIVRFRKLILVATIVAGSLALLHFSRPVSAANRTWDGGGVTNDWSEAANWAGDTVPGSFDIAVFDGTNTKNATIDTSINVAGIEIDSGYTGTISQSPGVNITISNFGNYSQADGTFSGGNGNFNVAQIFALSGGTFTSTTGTLSVGSNFTHTAGGTFNHNSGTVSFTGAGGTVDVTTSETFNNLSWNLSNDFSRSVADGDTLIVTGNLALNDGQIAGIGTIEARAGVTVGPNFDGPGSGSPVLLITTGDGNPRNLTFNAGAKLVNINLNAANVTISTAGSGTIDFPFHSFTLQAGTFQQGSVGLTMSGFSQSGGSFTGGSGVFTITNSGNYSQSGGTFTGGSGNIDIARSFTLSGGTFTSTSGTLSVGSDFTHTAGGTFNHNSGTVSFTGTGGTVDVATSETFNNLSWNLTNDFSRSVADGDTVIVTGNLALNDGQIAGIGTIEARAGVTVGPNFDGPGSGSPVLLITTGDGNPRNLTFNAGAKLVNINLNAANVTISTAGSGTIDFPFHSFTLQAGTFQQGSVGLTMSGFSQSGGSFTGGSGVFTITNSGNYSQSGGTFTGGSGNIDIARTFTLSGGTFTSTSGTLSIGSDFTHTAGGTFNHNSGTVSFTGTGGTVDVATSETFNNLSWNLTNDFSRSIAPGDTVIVTGNLAFNDGQIAGTGTISPQGNVVVASGFDGGNGAITFSGPANQFFTNNGGAIPTGAWTINKSSGRVTLLSDLTLGTAQPLNISSGIFDQGATFNLTSGPITIASTGRLSNQGTGDLTLGGNLQNDGTISLNGAGGSCSDPDSILVRSTANGTARTWTGSGSFFLGDVDVRDQIANNAPVNNINVFGGTDNPGTNTNFTFLSGCFPTATTGSISGVIASDDGQPIEGAAVRLLGTQNRMVVTDALGNYRFDNVETNGFYTVIPSRANYSFRPSEKSFSQLGDSTEAVFTGLYNGQTASPLDRTEYFVRQQYLDFLGREPDESGLNFWSNNIESCGPDEQCREAKRIDTSAAFFFSIEHQQTGYLVYRMYQAAYGDMQDAPVPVTFREFRPDAAQISQGVIVNQIGWQDVLETNKRTFAERFVQRSSFISAYPTSLTPDQFVDKLYTTAEVTPDAAERSSIIGEFGGAETSVDVAARGLALRRVSENNTIVAREFNQAFVLMEYFGYLQRHPNTGPDTDYSGYDFWLNKLESFNGNYRDAEMVKAFISSGEYRQRFRR